MCLIFFSTDEAVESVHQASSNHQQQQQQFFRRVVSQLNHSSAHASSNSLP